jgi:flagellar protein FliO/FliZ
MTDTSTALLLVRVGLSLGIVVGLILLASRVLRRRGPGLRSAARRLGPTIEVLERRSVGKRSSVALLRIDDRRVLVGVTEHQVGLIADLGEETIELPPGPAPIDVSSKNSLTDHTIATNGTPAAPDGTGMLVADLTDSRFALGTTPIRPPKLSLVQAVRELTVRRS